ncbi:hypothetical protein [Streptomyces luteocolor]|uniref:hypothetical protein n=1 Tax=Streptomyces luteocolor TaxID=285500 RepID=UPI0008536ECA|nr:hypothetical protein [Streptomyces luteocolor]
MTTRQMRSRYGTVRAALLALILVCLVPLFGINGAADSRTAGPTAERAAIAVAFPSRADARAEEPGCSEGQPGAPFGARALSPDQPGPHVPKPTPASAGPQDDIPALALASPPGTTAVDLHRIQVSRT